MWFTTVLQILGVIERVMPIAERFIPKGGGETKRAIVLESAEATAATLLPQVNMKDPAIQAALQAKIAADVALANLLQQALDAGTPTP